ncbi:TRAM domain-containing protein [Canibacter sp. lx-72]|uniref:class I SAM-dependent RNA methyltransferase n=1 Tax=Canibacter zhuwentaonis TaxID=2837491 RepID=UPI001BDC3EE8|nr:TRAM domain-containing protein [Canibacter zhuwentaonis]MBT1018010.1 TRAM domain-containing protein [Canibacter zhuwentaonis]
MTEHTSPLVGDELTLEITGIAHGGVSIARHDGRVFFVHDTLPGETVTARVGEVKKRFARATTVRVLEPSPHRQEHIWVEASVLRDPAERVGGAEFGHIQLAHQRALKSDILADALTRQGKIPAEKLPTVPVMPLTDDPAELGWRTRVRLHVDRETGQLGPYAARSNTVIPVASLPLAVAEINSMAPLQENFPGASSVDLFAPSADDPRMLVNYAGEKTAGAADTVLENVLGTPFQVRAGDFWQVHYAAAERLFSEVANIVAKLGDAVDPQANNLDLYGGVGLLSAAFIHATDSKARITSVEFVESATDLATENLAPFSGARPISARCEHYLKNMLNAPASVRAKFNRATVIADPPRTGLGVALCANLLELAPANIVYVACDPVAFARDVQLLSEGGYGLAKISALDMFPHTHHFETVCLLSHKG